MIKLECNGCERNYDLRTWEKDPHFQSLAWTLLIIHWMDMHGLYDIILYWHHIEACQLTFDEVYITAWYSYHLHFSAVLWYISLVLTCANYWVSESSLACIRALWHSSCHCLQEDCYCSSRFKFSHSHTHNLHSVFLSLNLYFEFILLYILVPHKYYHIVYT